MRARGLLLGLAALAAACGGETPSPTPSPSPGAPRSADPAAADWPMYGHDTSRGSYNPAETALSRASAGGLTQRFQAPVGLGDLPSSSGPVVAGGRVCVGSSVPTGDNYFCLDASTGAPLWSANVGHSPPFAGNVGIGSTAAIVDDTLYVGGGDAAYYALDVRSGRILWRHAMDIGGDSFAWSSPLVANGLAYVGMSSRYQSVRGELRALDAVDGSLRARQFFVPANRQGADIWNSPALRPDGHAVLVATGNDSGGYDGPYTRAIVSLDPGTLAILDAGKQATSDQDLDFGTTPVVFRDGSGRVLVGANEKNGTFFAYDPQALARGPVWQRATGLSVGAMPAYDPDVGAGGTLFVVGDNGLLFGLDPATGSDRWPPVAVGTANGNLAIANGLVFMGAGNGTLAVIAAESGSILRVLIPANPGRTFSGPAVSRGLVYWVSGAYLNAWGPP